MDTKKEVIYLKKKLQTVDDKNISDLIKECNTNKNNKIRICTHLNEKSLLQEMLIFHKKNKYVRPHKHLNKIESMIVIKGKIKFLIFNEDGSLKNFFYMKPYGKGKVFYHSMKVSVYHSFIIESDSVFFLEITQGPFKRKDTIFANWAPKDDKEGLKYLKKLTT